MRQSEVAPAKGCRRRRKRASRWLAIGVVAATASLPTGLAAQSGAGEAPSPWGLFSARYDTRTSDFIYAVYGYGSSFGMVAVLHNPRTDYSEVLGGIGRNFSMAGQSQAFALAVSHATEAWYAQLYYLPAIRRGAVAVRATTELYLPLERAGTTQFAFSPLSATVGVSRLVEAGIATDFSAAERSASSVATGPEIRVTIPKATLGADLQRTLGAPGSRLRVFFLTSF